MPKNGYKYVSDLILHDFPSSRKIPRWRFFSFFIARCIFKWIEESHFRGTIETGFLPILWWRLVTPGNCDHVEFRVSELKMLQWWFLFCCTKKIVEKNPQPPISIDGMVIIIAAKNEFSTDKKNKAIILFLAICLKHIVDLGCSL